MSIQFIDKNGVFKLDTLHSTYVFQILSGKYPVSLYYGSSVPDDSFCYEQNFQFASFSPTREVLETGPLSLDVTSLEYAGFNSGDMRQTAVAIENADGNRVTDFQYLSHKIYNGKQPLPGLPASFGKETEVQTLELTLKDPVTSVLCTLKYSVFEASDVIARSVFFENPSDNPVFIEKAHSASVNISSMDYDFVHLYGNWSSERHFSRVSLQPGVQAIGSLRGSSSHHHNPFCALMGKTATEDQGDVYAFHLLYSGNFLMEADCDYYRHTRVNLGIHPETFRWKLVPGDSFQTPEALLIYTDRGLGEMSRISHRFYLHHLIRSPFAHEKRPVLINSWEAAYFDINTEVLSNFARSASEMGMNLLVMDDGWFGSRDDDTSSLGDWQVDEKKFPEGLYELIRRVHGYGMKFGIWFEPEMISPVSRLFQAHPDWYVHVPNRKSSLARNQYVLDVSRPEVRDYVFRSMEKILTDYQIDYVKWDFNRNLSEAGSASLPKDRAGEFYHRMVLGTYDLMERFVTRFPHILFENCSGGGGRFDGGMLYYSPQIWTSDNTDPLDRLSIQFGTSLCYPSSTMGAHVSISDRAGYETKANIALWGTFGFELDPEVIQGKDREVCIQKIQEYHRYYDLIHEGDLYRVTAPWENSHYVAWEFVSPDKSEMIFTRVTLLKDCVDAEWYVQKFKGLDPETRYRFEGNGKIYSGAYLMNVGLDLTGYPLGDGDSFLLHFEEI